MSNRSKDEGPEELRRPDSGGIAIVGMACTYPGARNVRQFWQNIVDKVDSVTDVSPDRWDPELFFDPDPAAEDKLYCKKGGWIGGTFAFNPLQYGIPPSAIAGAEPDHFLVLRAVAEAMEDAGYTTKPLQKLRISVLLGKGNYLGPGVTSLMYRGIVTEQTMAIVQGLHPDLTAEELAQIKRTIREKLPPMNAEAAAGLIPNICTGRVSNRLDFMGRNFTVDAACASSLIALEIAKNDLESGREDMVLAGGIHIFAHVPFLQVFDAMRALSFSSTIRPYDSRCDGTIAGEGVGILVLKRLADAERDQDRIYAVIRGTGSSSDGRAKGLTAPRVEGEELALRRAYESSGIEPRSVELIEGHGTGTSVGDAAEVEALRRVFGETADGVPYCGLGSVKSMIGHAMPAAGAAGVIKSALALYHRVLPPTIHCESPRAELQSSGSPFYVNTEARPWIRSPDSPPRRAGVNAFGFGGVNAHIVLEEYRGGYELEQPRLHVQWDSEVFVLQAPDPLQLAEQATQLAAYCRKAPWVLLRDLAFTLNTRPREGGERLSVIATSLDDLVTKLTHAAGLLRAPECPQIKDRSGIYYFSENAVRGGKIAFMFPGEGSQYLNMLSELCLHFPEVRQAFDLADGAIENSARARPSSIIFPPTSMPPEQARAAEARLFTIDRATEAVLTADAAILNLLESLKLRPDMMVGHSAGEWIAMAAAGVLQESEFFRSFESLASIYTDIASDPSVPRMSMLAVGAGREAVEARLREIGCEGHVANDNCPHQVIAVVAPADEKALTDHLQSKGIVVEKLPYDRGYHTPAFTYICEPLRRYFSSLQIREPRLPLYSPTTGAPYPSESGEILDLVSQTFARPLNFRQTIEAMYEAGARIFVEVGPRGGLSAFVDDTLRGKPHLSVPIDQQRRPGILALNHALGMLEAQHATLDLEPLYVRRGCRPLSLDPELDRPSDPDLAPGTIQVSTHYPRLGVPAAAERRLSVPPAAPVSFPVAVAEVASSNGNHASVSSVAEEMPLAMASHFTLMEEFLATQEAVMSQFLAGQASPVAAAVTQPVPVVAAAVASAVASTAPAPAQAVPSTAVLVSVRTAEQLPRSVIASNGHCHEAVIASNGYAHEAVPAGTPNLAEALVKIVSERTGYPSDMLDLDLDMEADLGIDSIKRIEILGALREFGNGSGPGEEAMEEIARLKTLRQVLAMLSPSAEPAAHEPKRNFARSLQVIQHDPGQAITAHCNVDSKEHLYLEDHCLYFSGSDQGNQGSRVLSVPLTGSLEMMAEIALMLSPGEKVIGIRNMQAARWINVDQGGEPVILSIAAKRQDTGRVSVSIRSNSSGAGDLLAECTVVTGTSFPSPAAVQPLVLKNEHKPVTNARGIYDEHRMFHGPSFQGVVELDSIGDDGISGTLQVLPATHVFRSEPDPRFHIDPFLLDAAGQMVGCWSIESLKDGFVVLPIRVGELHLYRENLRAGERAKCQVLIRSLSYRQLKADIDIIAPDGSLWMRVVGWEDWRFYWQPHIYDFWRFPRTGSNGVDVTFAGLAGADFVCRRLEPLSETDKTGLWESLWMRMVLNRPEIALRESIGDDGAKSLWLTERAIAKDALRAWVKQKLGHEVFAPDVTVSQDGEGRMRGGFPDTNVSPFVSACSLGQAGFAVAGTRPVGVSIETVKPGEVPNREGALKSAALNLLGEAAIDQIRIDGSGEGNGKYGNRRFTAVSTVEGNFIFSVAFE